ncbi:AAA family ATPase [Microbulbifer thermotolerans]|uniref:AAA family ATPase n=1 Tax=Microbulbifer thermotolerans TaxID=252514 RepID=A0A143HPU3_MICTH|nr:MoxR family ATPase [Microbulbifer thermotolerans]AMX03743.1 AAA family ATPase [Microbulbifer thermotolerans]MCX2780682.1 MoxR family ATPase [Microbulbifer thermotolerans]MCX2783592.1 MoxR family ATPase [Microbulbifer thermotolerans]MCX2795803.1 MoxR family ATPase [Microbulbifer thermotolerans]MCX2801967.1 MoxR family ATPase [Microbulbifer thermotolerans]
MSDTTYQPEQQHPLAGSDSPDWKTASAQLTLLRSAINRLLIGQEAVVDQVLIALLASGHVLLEGVPGLGKTLLVRALANCFGGSFRRIQFTPDLMPADVTGHAIFDMAKSRFEVRRGPVFTNLLLADEINRAPAKTQAALLEVMQEKQVTIDGEALPVPKPFMVLATQNPIEQEGTYPLPEAELDRFLLKVVIDFPSLDAELKLAAAASGGRIEKQLQQPPAGQMTLEQLQQLQDTIPQIALDQQVLDYAVRLVRATREASQLRRAAGPRASIGLLQAARAQALLAGREFVLPDDVKAMAIPVMRHRVGLSPDMEIDGETPDSVLAQIIDTVEAPRL